MLLFPACPGLVRLRALAMSSEPARPKSLPIRPTCPPPILPENACTLGVPCGEPRSPTALRLQEAFWEEAYLTQYSCRPRIVCSLDPNPFGVLVYFMVFWTPDPPIRGALHPGSFHTTLIRAATVDRYASVLETKRVTDDIA